MALDIAMGGSTNTILHLLGYRPAKPSVDYTMADMDRLSAARVAEPLQGRAGHGERPRRGRAPRRRDLHASSASSIAAGSWIHRRRPHTVHSEDAGRRHRRERLADIRDRERSGSVQDYCSWPRPVRRAHDRGVQPFSPATRILRLDRRRCRERAVIRNVPRHAYSTEGGLADPLRQSSPKTDAS